MIKIILGTRPEIIKLSPLIEELQKTKKAFKVLFTNQHFTKSMGKDFLKFFNIDEKNIISNDYLLKKKPIQQFLLENIDKKDIVIVQGDTRSVYYGAIIAKAVGAKVYHIEAGLRTFDFNSPSPEEFYRTEVSSLADLNFCPTELAKNNLLKEGISEDKIIVHGNLVIQSIMKVMQEHIIEGKDQIMVTIHRKENLNNMSNIVSFLMKCFNSFSNIEFKVLKHPNNYLFNRLPNVVPNNVEIIEPMDYFTFNKEVVSSLGVITDSGGLQEECCYYNLPCCVIRDVTERPEAIDVGVVKLFNPKEKINHIEVMNFIKFYHNLKMDDINKNPYYDKRAVDKIMERL